MTTPITDRIADILVDEFKATHRPVDPTATFADLGFDSLVIAELALVFDHRFGIALADGELTDTMTITQAADLITELTTTAATTDNAAAR